VIPEDLDKFRATQRLAYDCAQRVADWLGPGVTEKQAAARLRQELLEGGADDFFHVPFAWFGDRTTFRGFKVPTQFFPTSRRLEEGMPYILDCAPVRDGYTADIGFAGRLGPGTGVGSGALWDKMDRDMREYRELILTQVRERKRLSDIYESVDALIAHHGYENRHRVYPGRVIGHRVSRLSPPAHLPRSLSPAGVTVFGFGIRTLQTLGRELVTDRMRGQSPLWADGRAYDHPPSPGLWAVEPHIGLRGTGLKFEEILVVTEDDAWWLDDDLPHVRRWAVAA
jgi:hypothetical protein